MKKIITLFLFILSIQITKAQMVTIPDANFVAWLQGNVPGAMTGNQMNTMHPSVTTKTYIQLYNLNISDLTGIQYFTSLDTFQCVLNPVTNLPVLSNSITLLILNNTLLSSLPPLPSSLLSFYCSSNTSLTNLPVLPPLLKELFCSGNQLTSLPNLPSSLRILDCKYNLLTAIPPLPNSLTEFTCWHNQITSLPVLPNTITTINCVENNLTILPTLPLSLTELNCSNNQLISLPTLPTSLSFLYCNYNQLANLPSLPNSLYDLHCTNNLLINLPILPSALNTLNCSYNQLSSLPLLPTGLEVLICSHNNISCFPLFPNIPAHYAEFFGAGPILAFEISPNPFTCLPNYVGGMDTVTLNYPLCISNNTLTNPNGCSNAEGITGIVFNDQNFDCLKNTGENGVKNGMVKLYDNSNQFLGSTNINANGSYFFNDTIGTYRVILDTLNNPYAVQCINPGTDSLVTLTTTHTLEDSVNFAVICNPGFDVGVQSIYRAGAVFPGATHYLTVVAGDMGQWYNLSCNTIIGGTVSFSINGPITYIGPAAGALTPNVVGNIYSYNIANFATINNNFDFRLMFTTDTTAQVGDIICVNATVTPITGDNYTYNNTYQHCYLVSNSCDPNIKEVYPVAVAANYTDWLTYTIHFQNTGNAAAINIRLEDSLDSKLDPETFQVINYSHYNVINVTNNHLTVRFPNIQLADSASNPLSSIGFIQYRIKPKAGWINDTIRNSADIYFDYNAPITTNTAKSFITTVGVKEISDNSGFVSLAPNPTNSTTLISSKNEFNKIELFSITGQTLLSETVNSKTHQLQLQNLSEGIYFAKISYNNGSSTTKKIIINR